MISNPKKKPVVVSFYTCNIVLLSTYIFEHIVIDSLEADVIINSVSEAFSSLQYNYIGIELHDVNEKVTFYQRYQDYN